MWSRVRIHAKKGVRRLIERQRVNVEALLGDISRQAYRVISYFL